MQMIRREMKPPSFQLPLSEIPAQKPLTQPFAAPDDLRMKLRNKINNKKKRRQTKFVRSQSEKSEDQGADQKK